MVFLLQLNDLTFQCPMSSPSRATGRQEIISSCQSSSASYSFGHGKRDVRTQQYMGSCFDQQPSSSSISPSPDTYQFQESVGRQSTSGKPSTAQWRFGTSDRSGRSHPDYPGRTPGPGAYDADSSMSVQTLSKRPSSAKYGFGTMERAGAVKLFISPMHAMAVGGAVSPGPAGTSRERSDGTHKYLKRPVSAQHTFGTAHRGVKWAGELGPGPGDYKIKDATFGRQTVSRRPTAPAFGFGSGDRETQAKVFVSQAMAMNPSTVATALSPGPAYMGASGIGQQKLTRGRSAPRWGFGTAPRFKGNGGMRSTPGGNSTDVTPGPGAYNTVY